MRQRGDKASKLKGKSNYDPSKYYLKKRMEKIAENKKAVSEMQTPVESFCKAFGCGKQLSAIENLYSGYCFKHQRIENEKASKQEKHLFRPGNENS